MVVCRVVFSYAIYTILFNQVFLEEIEVIPDSDAVVLRAVRGRPARLPCGNGRVFLDGPQSYILWLRADRDLLYRFPDEHDDRTVNGLPCDGISCDDHTSLLLKKVTDEDSGRYRCRVHYQASPSVDYVFEIKLVEPPGMPRIYDENKVEIVRGLMNPISLGSNLHLICLVDDNKSDTVVYWRRNNVMIERARVFGPGVYRADVRVLNVTRDELDAHYECLAQNADVTEPLIASVVIKMSLAPLSVEIRLNNNFDFEAGQPRVVDCVVVGCMPPPTVTWHLGTTMLKPSVHKELHDGNYTVSSLTLVPSLHNNHKGLVCRVHNSQIPTTVFEDRVTLNVGYRPKCVMDREETVGVIPREVESVTCVVDSSPEPLQFSWCFGNSKTLYTSANIMPGHANRYSSTLRWVPSDSDLGLLLCRATNIFGEQKRPCTFNISLGGPPQPPDCDVNRYNPNTWRIQCRKAWDGGRPQTVHLEIFDQEGALMHNVSDAAGNFHLPDLEDNQNMTAVAYSSNSRGKSETKVIYLQRLTPTTAPAVSETTPSHGSWTNWAPVIAVVAVSFALIGFIAYCLRKSAVPRRHADAEPNPDVVTRPDGSFHREPDFTRDERAIPGMTTITVNQLSTCQNQYSPSPVSSYRLLMGCGPHGSQESCPTGQHSYYV